MIIVVINKGLEVTDFDLFKSTFALKEGVQLELGVVVAHMILQQLLNDVNALKFIRSDAQNLKGLLLCDKTTFDPKSFLSYLFSALVAEFLHSGLHSLLSEVSEHLLHPLTE
jgi:hypothetical protein